jgi:hypothetical protein
MGKKEKAMIELTEQQVQALEHPEALPPRVVNPKTQQTFVLLSVEEYERLTRDEYDDSPWTDEEMALLAAEAGEMLDSFGKES